MNYEEQSIMINKCASSFLTGHVTINGCSFLIFTFQGQQRAS